MNEMKNRLNVTVQRKTVESADVCSFELVLPNGTLPGFAAGAHVDVHIGDKLIRQYSLCNNPNETHRYVIAVLREPSSRGGSVAMHDQIQEGDQISISMPRNLFALEPSAKSSLLLAGGIGITPIISMAEHLSQSGANFGLHYCGRSIERMAFIDRLKGSPFYDQTNFYIDNENNIDMKGLFSSARPDTHVYICGPSGFIDVAIAKALESGWSKERVHFERFSALEATEQDNSTATFNVQIASTGQTFEVKPNESIVDVLQNNGISIETSCEQGICGTCLTKVLRGVPEHRDMVLSKAERESGQLILPCCSRSLSDVLVLDL